MSLGQKNLFLGEKMINRYGCFGCHLVPGYEKAQPIGTELTEEGSKDIARLDFGFIGPEPGEGIEPATDHPIEIGTHIDLVLEFPNTDKPITAVGKAAWVGRAKGGSESTPGYGVGIKFSRIDPADRAALPASCPSFRWSLAKVTIRMLLEVATPMHMIAPISAGTLMVVPVRYSIQTMPASAPGRAVRMMNGSSHDWKFTTSRK